MLFSKRKIFATMFIVAIVLILSLNHNLIQLAAQGLFPPTPPPITPPPPGKTPVPDVSAEPPGSKQPSYIIQISILAGKVLHWTQISYGYTQSGQDPANGQPLSGEVWVKAGNDGVPIVSHSQSTLSNGTFLQESINTRETLITVFSSAYPKSASPFKVDQCKPVPVRRAAESLRGLLPAFVDEAALPNFGFALNGGLTKQLPSTTPLAGIRPTLTYGPENNVRRWLLTELRDGFSNHQSIEVGAKGRVLASQAQLSDSQGKIVSETWIAYGTLEMYASESVPDSVFSLSKSAQEVCRG